MELLEDHSRIYSHQVTRVLPRPNSVVGGTTLGCKSVGDYSMIRCYNCCKSHEMSAKKYIKIGGVALVRFNLN